MIKNIIRTVLGSIGYEIRRKGKIGFYAPYLSELCVPNTIFDIGVGYGTTELYKAYPNAKFFLIEPLEEFREVLGELAGKINCRVYHQAVSDKPDIKEIIIETNPQLSSLQERPRANSPYGKRRVEVTTLDNILCENPDLEKPILIKVDTEGHEIEVLKGASDLLRLADYVIAEVSVAHRFNDSYTFEDMILFMQEHGFAVFDFLSVSHSPGPSGTNMVDIFFKKDSIVGESSHTTINKI